MKRPGQFLINNPRIAPMLVLVAILALPLAVWRDVMAITDQSIRRQTMVLDAVVDGVRNYYAQNVVARLATDRPTVALHNYHEVEGAIPIPATFSIELADAINADQHGPSLDVSYRFISDYPFRSRPDEDLSENEKRALDEFRAGSDRDRLFFKAEDKLFDHAITMATPVVMEQACVDCHNTHPNSPKTDWQVGDVRAVQTFTLHQPIFSNLLSFKYLLIYLVVVGSGGILFALHQVRLADRFRAQSEELASNNEFLAGISLKISRYLSPQVYSSIFSGRKDAAISTERKKLTVFFSDIKDFTQTTESLQPEELTALLNRYFTEMSAIAEKHGATIDKFIGDAIVAFFGDPDSKGTAEDARACVRMALEMQDRLRELAGEWRAQGIETPFRARIGINTGYCNVGNFGSDTRMDYTIIGAEANLAARLESSAEPGGIVMSYETYAHVRDMVDARQLPPMRFKGIAREVIPYAVVPGRNRPQVSETSADGRSLTVHLDQLDDDTRLRLRDLLDGA